METKKIKGSEVLLLTLLEEGVKDIFGYPGGTIMSFYDDLYYYKDKLNHILVRHEQGAVHAAEGYSRSTGKVGVCVATGGPGATNFVTGIADAMMDSTPVVCITAQVNADKIGTNFFQEADMVNITKPITKWNFEVTAASQMKEALVKGFYYAQSGKPGPVVISITKNALTEVTEYTPGLEEFLKKIEQPAPKIDMEAIEKAADLINTAEKPLIIAGHGIILSGAEKELLELSEKGDIPVTSTLMGLSAIPSNFKNYLGMTGMHGNVAPNRMTQQADCILAVGMRFSDRVTGELRGYAKKAKVIHIEIDPKEINKNVPVEVEINADAKEALALLLEKVRRAKHEEWMNFGMKELKTEYDRIRHYEINNKGEMILMGEVVDKIANATGGNAIIVADVGQNQMFTARYSRFSRTKSWITSGGLGTMGFGLPASVGAKVGNPDREVIVVMGDGGFQMNIQELGTIMQSKVGVKMVLMNNTYLGMVRQWQELFCNERYSFTHLINPDFVEIASAYHIPAKRVTKPEEVDAAVKAMLETPGPYFLEVNVKEMENVFPMIPPGATLDGLIYDKSDLLS